MLARRGIAQTRHRPVLGGFRLLCSAERCASQQAGQARPLLGGQGWRGRGEFGDPYIDRVHFGLPVFVPRPPFEPPLGALGFCGFCGGGLFFRPPNRLISWPSARSR